MIRLTALALCLLTALTVACQPAAPIAAIDARIGTALAGAGGSFAGPSGSSPTAYAENAPTFSGPSALQHVQALANGIGSRVAGSPTQAATQQYLAARYQELGYQVQIQPFPITAYQDRGSKVSVSGASGEAVSANTLQYSAGGSVEGELVEAGLGTADDYEDAGVRGKVALVNRGSSRFAEKVDAATVAGALAVIVANNQDGNFNGSLIGQSTIPAVSVSQADGATLRRAIRAGGVRVTVEVNAATETGSGGNVVAVRPGGPQIIVIGAHLDSVAAGPGANDNGSGTAAVLELARVISTRQTPFTFYFVDFDAEEIGLVGSSHFVSQLPEEQRRSIVAMINLDMVGVGTASQVGGSDSLLRLARASAAKTGLSLGTIGESGGSDHASFIRAGIPALFIYRSNDPNYHSPNDRAEYVDPANLQIAGDLALDVIGSLERGE